MMHYIWMGIVGLITGAIAAFMIPGKENLPWWGIMIVGILGSYVGGFIGNMIFKPKAGETMLSPGGWIMSILGAILLLVGIRML
ncbi:MAG: GlsB/YeaQ/YmgE family stress response membrane protein [Burkholderiales bacterium]